MSFSFNNILNVEASNVEPCKLTYVDTKELNSLSTIYGSLTNLISEVENTKYIDVEDGVKYFDQLSTLLKGQVNNEIKYKDELNKVPANKVKEHVKLTMLMNISPWLVKVANIAETKIDSLNTIVDGLKVENDNRLRQLTNLNKVIDNKLDANDLELDSVLMLDIDSVVNELNEEDVLTYKGYVTNKDQLTNTESVLKANNRLLEGSDFGISEYHQAVTHLAKVGNKVTKDVYRDKKSLLNLQIDCVFEVQSLYKDFEVENVNPCGSHNTKLTLDDNVVSFNDVMNDSSDLTLEELLIPKLTLSLNEVIDSLDKVKEDGLSLRYTLNKASNNINRIKEELTLYKNKYLEATKTVFNNTEMAEVLLLDLVKLSDGIVNNVVAKSIKSVADYANVSNAQAIETTLILNRF